MKKFMSFHVSEEIDSFHKIENYDTAHRVERKECFHDAHVFCKGDGYEHGPIYLRLSS